MESILFSWQIDVIHLNHVTPAAHSPSDQHHTQGQLELQCDSPLPPFLTSFFFSSAAIRDDVCPPILPREWTNKTTASSYVYRGLSFPLKIYSRNKHPLWEAGLPPASQVIFSGVAALLCSLIRFPFLSGVISLSGALTNLKATVHLKEKNNVTSAPTQHWHQQRKQQQQQRCIITLSLWPMGTNVSLWSIWATWNIWIILFGRNWRE